MALDAARVSSIDLNNQSDVITPGTMSSTLEVMQWDSIISDSDIRIIQVVVLIISCGLISVTGLVANAINIIVFFRQGALSSSSNVSLLTLAFIDVGCLLPVFCTSVAYAVMSIKPGGLFVTPQDFMEVSTLWPRIMFVQIGSWITAYIAFERCICVVFPLKTMTLFSAKRSLFVVVTIALLFTISFIPTFATLQLVGVHDKDNNSTKLMFMPTEAFFEAITVSDYIHALFFRTLALVVVFVCTQITVFYVKLSKSWKKSLETSNSKTSSCDRTRTEPASSELDGGEDSTIGETVHKTRTSHDNKKDKARTKISRSNKERRLIRMITLISVIFLICNAPDIVAVLLLHSVSFLQQLPPMDNVFRIFLLTQFFMESINSSINIVVYYRMSSRYKQEFRAWLGLDTTNKK